MKANPDKFILLVLSCRGSCEEIYCLKCHVKECIPLGKPSDTILGPRHSLYTESWYLIACLLIGSWVSGPVF